MYVNNMESGWRQRIAIAIVYGLCVYLARQVVIPHWVLLTGLHLCALLLLRARHWAILMLVESALQVPLSIECAQKLGLPWAIFNAVPALLVMAPMVYWAKQRWNVLPFATTVNMWRILALSLAVSIPLTAFFLVTVLIMRLPSDYVLDAPKLVSQWMLGNYIGALTLTPSVLALCQWTQGKTFRTAWDALGDDRRILESIFVTAPIVGMLIWTGLSLPSSRPFCQVALFLPVIWLSMRHGWRGAALGGAVASFAVVALMPALYDRQTMQAEVIIALAISTMLLLGAHVTALNERAEREHLSQTGAIALAQRNLMANDMRLRMASLVIDQIRESVQASHHSLISRIRLLAPAGIDRSHQARATIVHDQIFRLSDVLHPISLRDRGLPAALRDSAIARTVMEYGADFTADFRGPFSNLTTSFHLAVYRTIVEIIAEACTREPFIDVDIRLRCGTQDSRNWVMVFAIFCTEKDKTVHLQWKELKGRIARDFGAGNWNRVVDRAATFEGRATSHASSGKRRVNVLMFEPKDSATPSESLSS